MQQVGISGAAIGRGPFTAWSEGRQAPMAGCHGPQEANREPEAAASGGAAAGSGPPRAGDSTPTGTAEERQGDMACLAAPMQVDTEPPD
eukprot:14710603-Alexandrium_andersonii.AAC.1